MNAARTSAAARLAGLGLLAAVGWLAGACASWGGAHRGFTEDDAPIQVVTVQIGGKNVFIPSTIAVTGGRPHTLSIYNTTDSPHGFQIPGLGVEAILPPGEEHQVVLPATRGHQLLRINCHLHPAHRTATLLVLPGD